MEFQQFIDATDEHVVNRNSGQYKVLMDQPVLLELNKAVPLIIPNRGCVGLGVPFELHISAAHTVIFYTKVKMDYSEKTLAAWYLLYQIAMGRKGGAGMTGRQDRDTRRTGMDAATRMMMGEARSARDIAKDSMYDADDDDDDDQGPSILDFMRQANPGDSFFR